MCAKNHIEMVNAGVQSKSGAVSLLSQEQDYAPALFSSESDSDFATSNNSSFLSASSFLSKSQSQSSSFSQAS